MMRTTIAILIILCTKLNAISQVESKDDFVDMKNWTMAVGTTVIDSIKDEGLAKKMIKFEVIGSGVMCYVKFDTTVISCLITARHVLLDCIKRNNKSVIIRPSSVDTLKNYVYYGLEIPWIDNSNNPNVFVHPNKSIDLAAIILTPEQMSRLSGPELKLLPYQYIGIPQIGDKVWVCGYPGHLQNYWGNFYYDISTFKPGYVTWLPNRTLKNPQLNHIALIESTVTYGNSGGPVFSFSEAGIRLVGIVQGGFIVDDPVNLNGVQAVIDGTEQRLAAQRLSGTAIIETSSSVLSLLDYVAKELKNRIPIK